MPPTKDADSNAIADLIEKYINENDVMIFSKSWCPYCKKIKDALRSANFEFYSIELDKIAEGDQIQDELINKTKQETVPNIFIKQQHIGGCDKTLEAMKTGRVAALLRPPESEIKHQKLENDDLDSYDYDLIVIGGGSGGLACSKEARSFDKNVCVLDFVKPTPVGTTWGIGGTCVNVGCIPKKLMHQASLIGEYVHDSTDYGWSQLEQARQHDWSKMIGSIQTYIRSLNFKYRTDLRSKGVVYENSYGEFVSPHRLKLTDKKGQTKEITGQKIVIAVGGRPKYPNIEGDKQYGITSDDLFSLKYDPGKTIVVGASYVALECAGFLHGIGRDVQVFVRSILLRGFDQQMASKIGDYMSTIGIKFHYQTIPIRVECLEEGKPGKLRLHYQQTLESGEIKELYEDCNTVLFAIGREACTNQLNLDKIGIDVNKTNGFKIKTNEEQSIDVPWLYAIGDCIDEQTMPPGQPLELTPVAIQAGQLLAKRIFSNSTIKMNYYNVPTTVFTPIEYGAIGYSEEDALSKFGEDNIEVFHSEFVPLEWSICEHREQVKTMSYCKLIVDKKTDRVIGFHVLSPNAGEITQGYALGMRLGATKHDFDMTVGIHPTCSENLTTLLVTKSSGESAAQEEIEFDIKNECSVRLETDNGIETCLNQKCSDYKDPWRVINSHIQDQPCYLHYLRLSFTTYDQLLVFIELQQSSNNPLENFFADDDTKHSMIDIEIEKIYPFNQNYFLSENMLQKLGGQKSKIDILQIEILNWYKSPRSVVQVIENDIVDRQPFEQITIFYQCNVHHTMERLVLVKYLAYQERSSCPTQINITKGEELLMSKDDTIYIQKYQPKQTYIDPINMTDDSFNKSHYINQNSNQWNLFAKIMIIVMIVTFIIAFTVYHYYCSPSQSANTSQ